MSKSLLEHSMSYKIFYSFDKKVFWIATHSLASFLGNRKYIVFFQKKN